MDRKQNIFGIDIAVFTAKETMQRVIEYLETETLNTIEIVTLAMLMQQKNDEVWKEQVKKFDLLLPGDEALFETSKEIDRKMIKDVENRTFLRMLFNYFQKNKKTLFLLGQDEEDLEKMQKTLQTYTHGLIIAGRAVLSADGGLEENVINEINGIEPDCVLSVLPVPKGEQFIADSRELLNARLWIGGATSLSEKKEKKKFGKIGEFITKKIFCYQMERQKTDNH